MFQGKLVVRLRPLIQFLSAALSRSQKNSLLRLLDLALALLAIYAAICFRFDTLFPFPQLQRYNVLIVALVVIKLGVFHLLGLYRPVLRYTGLEFLLTVTKAVLLSSGLLVVAAYLFEFLQLPRSVLLNDALITLLLVGGVRVALGRIVFWVVLSAQKQPTEWVVIYGAGAAGSRLAQALTHDNHCKPVAFVDDDCSLHGHMVQGLMVYSPAALPRILQRTPFSTILLAMPSIDRITRRQIIQRLQPLGVPIKTVPPIQDILSGKYTISAIRSIDITDLLGREEVTPEPLLLQRNVRGKVVLVTGAGGSIGSELCRQIAKLSPATLVLFELSEYALYQIDLELGEACPQLCKVACLGSVMDEARLQSVMERYGVQTVYHAAAYKHVPMVEANPGPGVLNNVLGTWITARCAIAAGVKNFVLISTDKAVRPTNVMGATKRVAELIIQALAESGKGKPCFAIVRFGNVLDSSGSVVPRFRQQLAQGQPLTVTHPEITRYFMSIPEAVRLVLQAGALATGGEVFLLDMGEPVRIYDLALQMIQLSGLALGRDAHIQITGLRPGEKLYEELLVDATRSQPTQHPKIFCAREDKLSWSHLLPKLHVLLEQARVNDGPGMRLTLSDLVCGYQPSLQPALVRESTPAGACEKGANGTSTVVNGSSGTQNGYGTGTSTNELISSK